MGSYRLHSDYRVITQFLQRVMLDQLLDNDTPATARLENDHMPQVASRVSQETLQGYFDDILQPIESHHHEAMSKYAWRGRGPEDDQDNGLGFMTDTPGDTAEKTKTEPDEPAKPKLKKEKKPESPGRDDDGEGSAT